MSIFFFSLIALFAHPPPSEEITSSANSFSSSSSKKQLPPQPPPKLFHNTVEEAEDVLVKCTLVTPHANTTSTNSNKDNNNDDKDTYHPVKGTLQITVHRTIAPLASNAFLNMVSSHHFDGNYLFRVVRDFIVQWGVESPPVGSGGRAKSKFPKVAVDRSPSYGDPRRSNVRGTLNFAGGNSATGQVYVNRKNNSYLDEERGSLPFATLDDESMEIVDALYDGYKEGMGQVKAVNAGEEEVKRLFPRMSRIDKCWIETG